MLSADMAAEDTRLGELYVRHATDAVRLAYLLTGDRPLAEDIVQDAFVRLGGRLAHVRDPAAFEAYLQRTVVNLSHSYFRRRKVERAYVERTGRALGTQTAPAADGSLGNRDALWRAMRGLSQRQRAAIVLRFYEDLSEQRVAEILRSRPGTVKSLVSRGLQSMRDEMRGEIDG